MLSIKNNTRKPFTRVSLSGEIRSFIQQFASSDIWKPLKIRESRKQVGNGLICNKWFENCHSFNWFSAFIAKCCSLRKILRIYSLLCSHLVEESFPFSSFSERRGQERFIQRVFSTSSHSQVFCKTAARKHIPKLQKFRWRTAALLNGIHCRSFPEIFKQILYKIPSGDCFS